MPDNTVRLKIKIEGGEGFKTVKIDADELRGAIERVKNEADKVNASLLNANQLAQTFDQVKSAVQGLQSAMHSITDAYSVQAAAEARLETVMRNTMDATEEEIQSIKDLAAAQQQLGIVGDEVQLTGAQELASYLSKKESLEKLIPVMNDMIAQQYGYNASAESAAQIASMMGKVMDGQVKALSRYGYSFTEAQEEILKFGTEEERAATLADVISQSVGGVNQAMAATPYGKIVQANNKFGDLKETLGSMIAPAMTVVDNIARVSIAVAGLGKGIATVKSLGASIRALGVHSKVTAAAQRMLGAAGITAAAGTTALRVAVAALYATMTLGLSLAIQAVIELITRLTGATKDASDATDKLDEIEQRITSEYSTQAGKVEALTNIIHNNNIELGVRRKALEELRSIVPEYHADLTTEGILIDDNTESLKRYLEQLERVTRSKVLQDEYEKAIAAKIEAERNLNRLQTEALNVLEAAGGDSSMYTTATRYNARTGESFEVVTGTTAYGEAMFAVEEAQNALEAADKIKEEIEGLIEVDEIEKATSELSSITEAITWQQMGYTELGKAIQKQKDKLGEFSDASSEEARTERALLQAMESRYNQLGRALGLVSERASEVTEELNRMPVDLIPTLAPKQASLLPTSGGASTLQNSVQGFQNLEQINRRIQDLQQQRLRASKDEIPVIDAQISYVEQLRDEFEGISKAKMPDISQAWSGIKGVGNSIRDIKDALTDTDNAWDALTQTIDGFISLFQSIQSVDETIDAITAATKSMQTASTAASATKIAENSAESASEAELAATRVASNAAVSAANAVLSTSNTAAAATAAANSVASTPFVGPALAIAAAEAVYATLSAIPKFAGGGIIYGPTVGLMGEYAGASNNPEVVAPLSKLRGMLWGGGGPTEIKFRIQGRELVGIYNKQANIYNRSK